MKPVDIKKKLEEQKDYLMTWLDHFGKAQVAAPYVQRNLETTEWELMAIRDFPDANMSLHGFKVDDINRDFEFVKKSIPMMPPYDKITDSSAVSSATASIIYDNVYEVRKLGTPEAIEYSDKYTVRYSQIHEAQDRCKEVRKLLEKFKSLNLLERFDRAKMEFELLKVGTGERTSLANGLRNLLDGIKGELFELARSTQNKNMNWSIMAARLTKGGIDSTEYDVVVNAESTRVSIISNLSTILKDREGGTFSDMVNVWIKVLDHVYTVLSLVKL